MTGSGLAPIVIPIVTVIVLAIWLALVFYADAHPQWKSQRTAHSPHDARTTIHADAPGQNAKRQAAPILKRSEQTTAPGTGDHAGQAASPPDRAA